MMFCATICASKKVNDAGELIDFPYATGQYRDVQREIAALPADTPLAEWGRWLVNDREDRSIAPGFTITRAGLVKLGATELAPKP